MRSRLPMSMAFAALALASVAASSAPTAKAEPAKPKDKQPSFDDMLSKIANAKPESKFARDRRLKREEKDFMPQQAYAETPHDLVISADERHRARMPYGPTKSHNQRQQVPKVHHRPRGRGR